MLLLERDLLDQQIIDVHGRKVVRVNDVDIHEESGNDHIVLKIGAVDVGARGAIRRLLKGVVPAAALHVLLQKIPPRMIPWEFVDLIEIDPARRVKLKISLDRLAKLHPADIADIVEDLAPAEREAIFETLDEEVAAETLEEIDPKLQVSILSSLDSDRAADIVEEMDPDAAADLLGDMHPDALAGDPHRNGAGGACRSRRADDLRRGHGGRAHDHRLHGVGSERQGGRRHRDAAQLRRRNRECQHHLHHRRERQAAGIGAVWRKSCLAPPGTPLMMLSTGHLTTIHPGADEKEVAELFDKYNLLTLPVIDDDGVLTGVITADDVINMLRAKL